MNEQAEQDAMDREYAELGIANPRLDPTFGDDPVFASLRKSQAKRARDN